MSIGFHPSSYYSYHIHVLMIDKLHYSNQVHECLIVFMFQCLSNLVKGLIMTIGVLVCSLAVVRIYRMCSCLVLF